MKHRLENLTLRQQMLFLPALTLLGLLALQGTNSYISKTVGSEIIFPNLESLMMESQKNALKSLVSSEAQSLARSVQAARTQDQKRAIIAAETDPVRVFDDKSGYFFSYALDGTRVNVPINKSGNGKNLIGLKDQRGFPFVAAMVEKSKSGGGFLSYYFEKPGKGVQPKLAYVELVAGTDVFIGAGVYIDNIEEAKTALASKLASQQRSYQVAIVLIFLLIVCATLCLALLLARRVSKSILQTVTSLMDGSKQVAAASSELSSQGQTLAGGASRQAAAIQETNASLDEMAHVTTRNSDNAQRADDAAQQARQAADRGAADMQEMAEAIQAINASSGDIAKIVRTIDEIAFQTNILALNAAVEAARAGEAGMGFAVVADEVRNLAQRSAQAARETTEKIEGAIARTTRGVNVSEKVKGALNDIVSRIAEVTALASEVSDASVKQTESIRSIRDGVTSMQEVTQGTAANAEESAAAAEELNAQAFSMQQAVRGLLVLAGGRDQTA